MSLYPQQYVFGAGALWTTRTDITTGTPRQFGTLQDVSVDFSADLKELFGQGRYAAALAPGKTKVEVKAKLASINGALFNDLYFGATTAATQTLTANGEAATVPSSVAYTCTVANSTKFLTDLGVTYAATGQQFTKVTGSPTIVGTYSVASGVYTFYSGDASASVLISYTYSSTSGLHIPISNIVMGSGPAFSMVLNAPFDGRQGTFTLNSCRAAKLSLPLKQDDWQISEIDFQVSADSSGNIGAWDTNY